MGPTRSAGGYVVGRRWLVNHYRSLDEAVRVVRASVRFADGWRWRVYGMRLDVLRDGSARSVRDGLLAEGLVGSGSGTVGQLPVWRARSRSRPAARLRRVAAAAASLDSGEQVRMLCWPTMPSATAPPRAPREGPATQDGDPRRVRGAVVCWL